jgi:ATP-dependent helicase IRC3
MTVATAPCVMAGTHASRNGHARMWRGQTLALRTLGLRMREAVAPPPFRLTPRPYQYEAVAALLAATARGIHRPLLVLPTGTGKTIVFALLVQRRRGRSLILAHRDELIQQAVAKLHLVDPTLPLGVVQAARDEHTAPTVVASVQTLSRRSRLARLVPDFQTIVIDEAHHAPAPTYRRILEYCRAWASRRAAGGRGYSHP